MQESDYITDICQKEVRGLCYEPKINGISVYNYIKRQIRSLELKRHGCSQNIGKVPLQPGKILGSFFLSLWQVLSLLLLNKKASFFIYSFFRTDSVNGKYLDKFTDPLVDYTSIKDDYVIFDRGNHGIHRKPRLHHKKIVYTDAINDIAYVWAFLFVRFFVKRNDKILERLWQSINHSFPEITYDKKSISRTIYYLSTLTKFYGFLMRRMGVRYMLAPARHAFLPLIPAAKVNGVKVLELQHGITYSETLTYSGFRDSDFTPDFFLSFGEMHPDDVYGIEKDKIINIGWAFGDYIKKNISDVEKNDTDVLVISEPQITKRLISAVMKLASENQNTVFYFRPHPLEHLDEQDLTNIKSMNNVRLDDNTQNIMATLMRFMFVIGENSTVLYEALSMGKKVGKIRMDGLQPIYLQPEDEQLFGTITDIVSFQSYLGKSDNCITNRSIYAPFSISAFEKLLT